MIQVADPRRRVKMTKGKATDAGGSMDIGRKGGNQLLHFSSILNIVNAPTERRKET